LSVTRKILIACHENGKLGGPAQEVAKARLFRQSEGNCGWFGVEWNQDGEQVLP
jgi:hypothetical protein